MRRAIGFGLAAWGLIALWLMALRLIQGDQAEAYDLGVTVSIIATTVLAPIAAVGVLIVSRPFVAGLLAATWTAGAVFGGADLAAGLFPRSHGRLVLPRWPGYFRSSLASERSFPRWHCAACWHCSKSKLGRTGSCLLRVVAWLVRRRPCRKDSATSTTCRSKPPREA